jgi:hypothetical protein
MPLSTHYYVLSLGLRGATLFEAFRDSLITVRNQGFPVPPPLRAPGSGDDDAMRMLACAADRCLDHYYRNDPLGIVVTGDRQLQAAFRSVTTHGAAVIGMVDGDHTATPPRDLGQIAWPVVKEAMSGALDGALRDLASCAVGDDVVSGLEAVAERLAEGASGLLLVEEGFHARGRVGGPGQRPIVTPDVDIRDATDDAVDEIIGRMLDSGGRVVFPPRDSLRDHEHIVLLLCHEEETCACC